MANRLEQLAHSSAVLETASLPRAIRPAVEIIARLSAERGRLREEVRGRREELRRAPRRDEVDRLRAERDRLAREVARLKSGAARRAQAAVAAPQSASAPAPGLAALVARLERAVARVERAPLSAGAPSGAGSARSDRPTPRRVQAATATAAAAGSGLLAGLVRANVALRSDAAPREGDAPTAAAAREAQPASGPGARPESTALHRPARERASAGAPLSGGGPLAGLMRANLDLRRSAG